MNYVIATHAGRSARREKHDKENSRILQKHMKALAQSLEHTSHVRQVTIIKPRAENTYEDYYDIDDYIAQIEKLGIEVVSHETAIPFKSSYSQYLYAYSLFPGFDHYIIMEDDWTPFPEAKGFDAILLEEYAKRTGCKGFLSSWVTRFEHLDTHSAISVGIIGGDSFQKIINTFPNTLKDRDIGQMDFSLLFTRSGLPFTDYSEKGSVHMIPFWETNHGVVYEYALHLSGKYLLVPVQFLEPSKYPYVLGNWRSASRGGSHPPSEDVRKWVEDKEYLKS